MRRDVESSATEREREKGPSNPDVNNNTFTDIELTHEPAGVGDMETQQWCKSTSNYGGGKSKK